MTEAASELRKNSPLADADGHRAALACGDDLVTVALLDHGDGIGAHDLPQGLLHGFE